MHEKRIIPLCFSLINDCIGQWNSSFDNEYVDADWIDFASMILESLSLLQDWKLQLYYYFLDANIRESKKVKSPAFSFGLKTKPDPNPVSPSPNTYNTSGITTKGRLTTIRIIFYKLHILQEKIVQCPPVFISKSRIQRSLWLHLQEPTIPNLPAKKQQLQPLFILLE